MKFTMQKIIYFTLLFSIYSCWKSTRKITDEILGTYNFEFPRGDYELLKIYKDSSFVQEFYVDKESFNNKVSPFYTSKGKWSIKSEDELRFDNWLEYCYLRYPDTILPKPKHIGMGDVYWERPNKIHMGRISIDDETNYFFVKISGNVTD